MEQSGSCFDINSSKEITLFQREDSKVKFVWDEKDQSEQDTLASEEQSRPQWNEFTENTTFHGIKYIFDFNASKSRRALWVCCVLMSVGLFLGQVFSRVNDYFAYETNVHVAVFYDEKLDFPAVTICNQNNFRLTKTLEKGKLVYEFIDKIYSESEILDIKEFDISDFNETLSKMDLKEFITTTAHQKDDLIDSCRWKGQPCNRSDFKMVYTDLGVCYSFNFDPSEIKSTNIAGNRGLSIVMNVEQYEYMRGPQNDAGLKILLHHQNDTPRVKDLGFSVAPGTHAEIGINLIKKHYLSSPYGYCKPDAEPLSACITECRAITAHKICNCTDLYMNHAEAPICDMDKAFRCIPYSREIGEGDLRSCQCSSPCEQSLYEHSFSFATLSKFNIERVVLNDPNENLRVNKRLMHAKEMAVRNIPKYRDIDEEQIKDILDTISWIKGNLTVMSDEWEEKSKFSSNFKSFDIIFMGEDVIEKDTKHDFFQKRRIFIDCLVGGKIPDINGNCHGRRDTSKAIINVVDFIVKLERGLFNPNNDQPLLPTLEDCFNRYGNLELNMSSSSSSYACNNYNTSSNYNMTTTSWPVHSMMSSNSTTTAAMTTTAMTTTTTMSPGHNCRNYVQCKAHSALELYNGKPEFLDGILDLIRSDINFTKEMILLNTTRTEDDLLKKYEKYAKCLFEVENLQNITSTHSLVTISQMLKEFDSLRHGQLEDLLNHTRNMTTFFNYQLLLSSYMGVKNNCTTWVTKSFCSELQKTDQAEDGFNEKCHLKIPQNVISMNLPHYNHVGKKIKRVKEHWAEFDDAFDGLQRFMDETLTKANLSLIFLSPDLANKLSIKSGLVNDLIDVMKTLKDTLTATQSELKDEYKVLFSNDNDWFTHDSIEEFALVKYLREMEQTGHIHERLKGNLDDLHKNHSAGLEHLLTSVCHLRKEGLQQYIDFLEEKAESLFNTNMKNIIENLSLYSEELKMDEYFFMANFLQVDIFYKELKYQKIEQQSSFKLISLFSEIGGFLGLLLGASVLTVCELLDYIALIIISRMQKIKSSKVTAIKKENQPNSGTLS